MSDIHALSGAYAVDALDDIERAQFERHLRACDTCNSEIESLRDASALLAETSAFAPSAALRERVLAEIATVRPLPPLTVPTVVRSAPVHSRRWPALVAAAAAVVAVGVGVGVTQPWADNSSQAPTISAADRVLRAADAETFTNSFPGGVDVTVVRSKSLGSAVVIPGSMPPAPNGHAYALWLQHENTMDPAGVMKDTDAPVVLTGDEALSATGAAISIEPVGSSLSNPSDNVVALFDFDQV